MKTGGRFGALPKGERLERIRRSPHYLNGHFLNLVPTVQIVKKNRLAIWWAFAFPRQERLMPADALPSIKTDLKTLDKRNDAVVWLGHSSYFMVLGGYRILIDPVFSAYASPVPFANRAFARTDPYTAVDMPDIDYLLISHDHWDHLDYPTVAALKPKIKHVICGLGVGAHFEAWGFEDKIVHEADWFTELKMGDDFVVRVLPARHYSGRLLPNKTLWASYALLTPNRRVFFGGDSGYGPHFKEIGKVFAGFDLAIMENGQYNAAWPNIHMMPEEVAEAAEALHAKALLPGHAGKFILSNHAWDDPFKRIVAASQGKHYRLLTPMIGEPVKLDDERQVFTHWWEGVR